MAILKKSPLEFFVSSFVKQKARFKVPVVYIDKAIVLIDEKVDPTCCTESGPVDIKTFRDNLLTRSVRMYLNTMPKSAANLKSLARTKILLQEFKQSSCCD